VGGSDPGGGAGIQLDLKVLAALGADGAAVPALLTVQGPAGLECAEPQEPAFVARQMRSVFATCNVAAVKTGALGTAAVVGAVAEVLAEHPEVPVVCDPVCAPSLRAVPGARLLEAGAVSVLRERLLPRVTVLTPNLGEAAELTGRPVSDRASMEAAAAALLHSGCKAVMIKGGHLAAVRDCPDLLRLAGGPALWLPGERLSHADSIHGTGCALASSLATYLARGYGIDAAARHAKAALHSWLASASGGRLLPR